ncbi:hypothetical protein B566_EDAN011374 [Ephemera danica]|nr:hypothetical protein B566_EDAN011374 [Ephemera danica]
MTHNELSFILLRCFRLRFTMDVWWITLGLLVFLLCLLYTWSTSTHDYWAKRNVPFLDPVPFFGNMAPSLFRRVNFSDHFKNIYNQLKPHKIGGFYEFRNPVFMPIDPEVIREITVKNFDHFHDRRVIAGQLTDPLFARSLPSLKGAEWREMRNRLSPAFTTSKLRAMFPLIERCGKQFAHFFVSRPDAHTEPIEFKGAFTRFTNDVIATVAFGHECKAIANTEDAFYKKAVDMTTFKGIRMLIIFGYMLFPKVMTLLRISFIPKSVTAFFENLIQGALDHRRKTGETRPDMLQLLMAAQKGGIERAHDDEQDVGTVGEDEHAADFHKQHLTEKQGDKNLITEEDIAAQAFIFFFAGFETVATMMSFLVHELAVNPDIQEKLRAEVDDTFAANNGKLTYESIQKMQYMDMVTSESLRKYPPAGITDRTCIKNFKVPNTDIQIEAGNVLVIPMYPLHHDPEYFPDPERFDPERFTEENRKNIRPYTYLPHATGFARGEIMHKLSTGNL